ncbi:hypothetical protein H4Q26_003655 [Puccinia striiformis f. sp. tritici PST-130]|nr:hypothetical protein H4Q26_003655 [Puccinia striiformis f. sp. tritici PST-130]
MDSESGRSSLLKPFVLQHSDRQEDNGIFFKNTQSAAPVAYGETVVSKEVDFQLIFSVSKKYQQPITTASVKESIPDVTKSLTKTYKPVVDILQRFHAYIEKFRKAFVFHSCA